MLLARGKPPGCKFPQGGCGKELGEVYSRHTSAGPRMAEELAVLARAPYQAKLLVMKSKKKADQWRKKFLKDFYIPRGLSS